MTLPSSTPNQTSAAASRRKYRRTSCDGVVASVEFATTTAAEVKWHGFVRMTGPGFDRYFEIAPAGEFESALDFLWPDSEVVFSKKHATSDLRLIRSADSSETCLLLIAAYNEVRTYFPGVPSLNVINDVLDKVAIVDGANGTVVRPATQSVIQLQTFLSIQNDSMMLIINRPTVGDIPGTPGLRNQHGCEVWRKPAESPQTVSDQSGYFIRSETAHCTLVVGGEKANTLNVDAFLDSLAVSWVYP